MAARADAEEEVGRGGTDDTARPDIEIEAGRGDADSAAQPVAGGGAGRGMQESPASQRALAMEETHIPEPVRTEDEGTAAAAAMACTAPENMVPVVQLPESSDEFEDSRGIDPAAATSAADRFAEFVSASKEVLSAVTSEGPRHGAIIQSGVPLEFLRSEQEEEAV